MGERREERGEGRGENRYMTRVSDQVFLEGRDQIGERRTAEPASEDKEYVDSKSHRVRR